MIRTFFGLLAAALVTGALVGCGGAGARKCTGPSCDAGGGSTQTTVCVRDSDCPAEQACVGFMCEPRTGDRPSGACTKHQDCNVGLFCNVPTGQCVQCLNEDHCQVGEVCRADGTCGTDTGCSSNTECGGRVCDTATRTCVQCLTSANCPTGQTCRDKQCLPDTGTNPVCQSQIQCDTYARICDATGHCVPCTSTPQCGAGRVCTNGSCVSSTTPPGPTDGSCTSSADCGGQACVPGLNMCMPCFSDFMCFDVNDLLTGVSKICDLMSGNCIAPQCQTAAECPAGQGCYSGHCGECMDSSECRANEVCDLNTGVCGTGTTPPPTGCSSNAGCSGGQVCVSQACVNCTASTQCDAGQTCTAGRCGSSTPVTPGTFGASCNGPDQCGTGLACIGDSAGGTCTRTCIGSGNGGDADCPSGWACYDSTSGPLDGSMLCESTSMLPASTPGQPFDQAPGASCAAGNRCQTGVCDSTTNTCVRSCAANRDCDAGEVCYAVIGTNNANTGEQFCYYSNTTDWAATGAECNNAYECDSGLCVGSCTNGDACNSNTDCTSGTCTGVCSDHCRSNADCATTEACNPWALDAVLGENLVPVCTPKYYTGAQTDGSSCTTHSVCKSDWCVGGICTTPCAIKADCAGPLASKSCEPVTFNDTSGNPLYTMAFCQ
ncbi:MAG: hypothetical protein HY903_16945 [Deltaproteobacteria bacterium]|nr:hypothetical protein [Deltaproteobacteria bacterium]